MSRRTEFDAVVIGVGGMGSAAVCHLAERGVDVLGIERYDVPHARGSSHGETRQYSLTQKHPDYVPLARRAGELWRGLEDDAGRDLFTETGSVFGGEPGSASFEHAVECCAEYDLPHDVLTGAEVNERYPGYELPEEYRVVHQPDGGFIACERAITTYVARAQSLGATVRARERVLDWRPTESGVVVETDRNRYEAENLVVTAGAWASKHVRPLENALKPQRRVMAWLQPEDPSTFRPENFPVFTLDSPEGNSYGFPVHEQPGFKFGRAPERTETIDPDDWRDEPTLQDEELLRMIPERLFPEATGPTMRLTSCIVTRSLDGDFYLGTHPEYPHVSVGAGFSGIGFKYASVVGEVLADLATERETDLPIERFRLDRIA
ncbi:N-methyl-L-tryptophan oxidase [Halorubrum rubrum]|uniref:N-methyl-L-tryptophan oxidase n=1 Tax=Halorubrum rubrum TaxID=1126240 RepID=A0ABD5R304_9EURY|nr:N-methyl-L-tryptophan oxidase [Halorubrum rubrum]